MKIYTTLFSIIILFSISSCTDVFFETEPLNNPIGLFEELWQSFEEDYAIFEERNVDWKAQYDLYRPQVTDQTTDDELHDIFRNMLRPLDDGHVSLVAPNKKYYFSNLIYDERIDDELFDLDVIKENYLDSDYSINGYDLNTYGLLEGNIGYVHMVWVSDNFPGIHEILDDFENTNGLIIDFRHNGGGDLTWAFENFGRFTDQERYTHRTKTKNGKGKDDYDEWHEWRIYPKGRYYDRPIVLLTDRFTLSAAERATMAFKSLPNVTQIGDTTSGGISTKVLHELPNGWYYSVCPQKSEFLDGKSYEGIGFDPDISVINTMEEINNGIDRTLEAALNHLQ